MNFHTGRKKKSHSLTLAGWLHFSSSNSNVCDKPHSAQYHNLSMKIKPIKDRLQRQYFPENDAINADVEKYVVSGSREIYKHSMKVFVHHWHRWIANDGDYMEKIVFSWKLAFPTVLLVYL